MATASSIRGVLLLGAAFALLALGVRTDGALAISSTPNATTPYYVCTQGPCALVLDPPPIKTASGYAPPEGGPAYEGGGELGGFDPRDLQSAYDIPTIGGSTQTVGVIDPYDDPAAASDLKAYRERYGLSACTKANGCFRRVNQLGEEGNFTPPPNNFDEYEEILEVSTDLDMVSAACPECHILLVEAKSYFPDDMSASVNTAVRLGATEISASFGYPENGVERLTEKKWCKYGCEEFSSDWSHPGIPIAAAAGDFGYLSGGEGAEFPATLGHVIAVGGTSLHRAKNARGWREEVWEGSGSGCSKYEAKPEWQHDTGCAMRTANDVAAVASENTPVSIYNLKVAKEQGGWGLAAGTSVATPLIAGMEAHATEYTRALGPLAFYLEPQELNDVTSGHNGKCSPVYLCTAEVGYDGPTGMGTPAGIPFVAPNEGGH